MPHFSISEHPRLLRPSPTAALGWRNQAGRAHVILPYLGTPIQPPTVSYRRTQFVFFPLETHAPPLYIDTPMLPLTVSYCCTQCVHLLMGPMPRLPTSAHPRRLRLCSTGGPSWCISREGPVPRALISSRQRRLRATPTGEQSWLISQGGSMPNFFISGS